MKKILFLLLFTIASYGQAVFDEGIQITGNANSATATKVNVQEANGKVNTQTINTGFNKNFGLNSGDVVGANTLLNQYATTPVDWTATAFNSGQVVFYGGKQWIAKIATVAGDVPSVSSKWEEITFEALANKTTTVDQTIIDGSTNAVSGNAVFDGLALKSPLESPSLTGTPTAPTATAGTNTTQIATTAFVTTSLESVGFTQIADGSNVVDFTIDGKQARVTTSSDYSINGNPKKLAIFLHHYGGNYTILPSTELKNSLLENGYSIATMSAGENWGNEQAQQLYAKLYNYVIKKFNVDKQPIAVSSSMGTLVSLNLINRNIIPFRALVSTVGVVNLSEYYGRNSEVSAGADIRTAYGFTNLVDAEKAFLGFDPYTRLKYNFGDSMFKTSCPIYFINGEIDTSSPIEYTQKIFDGLKRDYSNSVLEIVAGVGHDQGIVTTAIASKVISWLSSNALLSTRTIPDQYVTLKTNNGFQMIDNTLGDEKFNYIEFKKKDDTRRGLFGYLLSSVTGANGMSWVNEQGNIGIYSASSNRVSIGVANALGIVTNVLTTDLLSEVGRVTVNGNLTATNYTGGAVLTGTPTAPTAPAGTNTTQIATTAFVNVGLATKENAFSKNTAFNKPFGITAGTVVEGNDSRLSDSRTPTAGSNSYIQNQNTSAQSANMWISGNSRLTSVKANGRFYSIGDSNFDDLVSTTGAIIMSYDSVNTISNITSRNYSTSTSLPLQFEASSYSFLNGAATFASSVSATSFNSTLGGNFATSSGNVLIGTTTDNGVDKVQVAGTISASPATTANQVVVKSQLDAVASSGTYTPTFSNLVNVGTVNITNAVYTKVGNIIQGRCTAVISATTIGLDTSFDFSLPQARNSNTNIFICGNGARFHINTIVNGITYIQSINTGRFIFKALGSVGSSDIVTFNFQYDITQ